MKKTVIGIISLLFLLTSVYAQTRGLGVKKSAAQKMEVPTIELNKDQICNVYSIAYSTDGKHIAAGYNDSIIRIWNIQTGEMEKELKGHNDVVWSVAYSPDGTMLVSGSADKTNICWNIESGKIIRTLTGHKSTVSFVTFDTLNSYIASGSTDGTIKFWEASTGELLQTLTAHTKTIASISYSNSDKFVASASWDTTVKIFHTMGGREKNTLQGHEGAVYAVEFSPDENYLATGSADRTIKIWDSATGELQKTIKGYSGEVWYVAYSPDGKYITGCDSLGTVKSWNIKTGELFQNYVGHKKAVRSVCYSKDGKYLYSGDSDGIIKMWKAETGELISTMLQCNKGGWVTWTPDGYLTGSADAIKSLSYTVSGKKYSLEEIKDTVYKPAIVAANMSETEITLDKEAPSLQTIIAVSAQPAVKLSISNTDGTPRKSDKERDIIGEILLTDTGGGIGRVFIKLNGRLIKIADKVESKTGETVSLNFPTPISLRSGKNTISINANNGTNTQSVYSNEIELNWKGAVQKARLFVFAVGIDSYNDKNIPQLTNCVNDAQSIIDMSQKYAGDLYKNVYVKLMKNSEVTKDNLLSNIKEFGKAILPDDVFILYLAGHGITHTDGDYYYIPYDFKERGSDPFPTYGVSKWSLIDALSDIQAENMTIVLDTCNSASFNSGKVVKSELEGLDKNAIIDRFAAKAGYDLIAACSSYQNAIDDYKGHGLFTYCLLDAIQGKADLDSNGQVTSAEFATYIIKEVPIVSNKVYGYKQEPQRSQPLFDYPMFGKLNPTDGESLNEALAIAKAVKENGITLDEAYLLAKPSANISSNSKNNSNDKISAPIEIGVSEIKQTTAIINWKAVDNATNYAIYCSTSSSDAENYLNMSFVGTTKNNSYLLEGLEAGETYYYRIISCKNTLLSNMSDLVTITTAKKIDFSFKKVQTQTRQITHYYDNFASIDLGFFHSGIGDVGFILGISTEGVIIPKYKGHLYLSLPIYIYPFDVGFNIHYNWHFFESRNVAMYVGTGIDLSFRHVSFPLDFGMLLFNKLKISYQTAWNCKGYFEDTILVGYISQ